ncbi:MAG: hypothetical protein H6817_06255 [Phycisphaerales bacterium]|nr:hypothetical protein [Phycisphaerales bacterium]
MIDDLISIGWRPTLIGNGVMMIGAVAGWGMAGDPHFAPVHWLRLWMEHIILPGLRQKRWAARAAVIFLNNATICALLVGLAKWPAGAWVSIVIVGLSLGAAIRLLQTPGWEFHDAADNPEPQSDDAPPAALDRLVAVGLLLNLLEVPAITLALGLAMGRCVVPNHMLPAEVWRVYAFWVAPLLIIAASGESLWIGRRSPF